MQYKIELSTRDARKPTLMEELRKRRDANIMIHQGLLTAWDR